MGVERQALSTPVLFPIRRRLLLVLQCNLIQQCHRHSLRHLLLKMMGLMAAVAVQEAAATHMTILGSFRTTQL